MTTKNRRDTPHAVLATGSRNRNHAPMATGRGGRPSKGARGHLVTRPHTELDALVRASAHALGMSVSDYLAWKLAEVHGRPELAPPPPDSSTQGTLPLERGGVRLQRTA